MPNLGDMSGSPGKEQDPPSKISSHVQDSSGSTISSEDDKNESEQTSEKTSNVPATTKGYSTEARTYHARYDQLSKAHDHGHYTRCRQGCLDLLTEPRIPLWTRIQTLQMLSTISQPASAEMYLDQAESIIDMLDPTEFQTGLLREDNRKMKADRHAWRVKMGLVGRDIEGVDGGTGEEHVEGNSDLDRAFEGKAALKEEGR